jgi:hypothetical protein
MVNISDNPNYQFKRKVDNDNVLIIIDCKNQYVILQLDVYNFTQEDVLITDIPAKPISLKADNNTKVTSQGVPTEVIEDQVMGEFDFFKMMMNNPVIIDDLISAKIQWADFMGRFD